MTTAIRLPVSKQLAYAAGQLGFSALNNTIALQLVYFYLPPSNAGLPYLITTVTFLGILNAITIIAASGRLLDAITDPLIAHLSDRAVFKRGKRTPFMAAGAIPAAVFCWLMFMPPVYDVARANIYWLFVVQILFYVALTVYVTPYFALLPELGHTPRERLNLSTWLSITFALGLILAAQTPTLAAKLQEVLDLPDKLTAFQYAIGLVCLVSALLMLLPVFAVDERVHTQTQPSTVPLFAAVSSTFVNPYFRYYVFAAFTYFISLTLVNTGLLFYITVLLGQPEIILGRLLTVMVGVAFALYPVVNLLAGKLGNKKLVLTAAFAMGIIFLFITFLGRYPIPPEIQGYILVIMYAFPLAFLGVLTNTVLADIVNHDHRKSGQTRAGMFFAVRTLTQKFGQTLGIVIFAGLSVFGRDPGNDLGIRLSGVTGFLFCMVGAFVFMWYDERTLRSDLARPASADDSQPAHPSPAGQSTPPTPTAIHAADR